MKFASPRATVLCAAFVLQFGVSQWAQSEPAIGGIGGPLLSGIVTPKPAASNSAPTDPTYINCTKPFGGGQQPAVIVSQCTALINANKLSPEYLANVFYYRGNAFFAQQDYYTANVDYASAIRLNPKYSKAYNNRAFASIKQGNYAAAIPDLNQAIALDPAYLQAYRNRAQAYAKTGDLTRAKGDYDQAIALDPKDGETYYNRGVVNYQSGRFADAVADYDRALQINPADKDAANNRALAQQALSKAQQMYADQEAARQRAQTAAIVNSAASIISAYNGGVGAGGATQAPTPQPQQSAGARPTPGVTGSLPVTSGGAPCASISSSGITPHTPGKNTTSSKPWTRFDFLVGNQCERPIGIDIRYNGAVSSLYLEGRTSREWFCTDGYFGNTDCPGGNLTWASHWAGN